MNPRRKCLALIAIFFLGCFGLMPAAQAVDRVYRLLIVDSQKGEPYQSVREAMLKELEKNGYRVGVNLLVKHYSIGNQEGATRSIWEIEKDLPYDAIFSNGTMATIGLHKLAADDRRHKVVFGAFTDPVGEAVIDRFDAPPKGNFTGVCYPVKISERLRFIRQVMPNAKVIGLIDTEMPQSKSYRRWIEEALKTAEFKDMQLLVRTVPFVRGEEGHRRMAELAKNYVNELNPKVDFFLACNDQMCVQREFSEVVAKHASKPLVALSKKEVVEGWGGAMSIYPDQEAGGRMVAGMIVQLFKGKPVQTIYPRWPPVGYAFNLNVTGKFGIRVPQKLIEAAGRDAIDIIFVPKIDNGDKN